MSIAPMTTTRSPLSAPVQGAAGRRVAGMVNTGTRTRAAPTAGHLARRRILILAAKLVLPLLALLLLASIALWPDIARNSGQARFTYRRGGLDLASGEVIDPRYHGVDEKGRPYTITATRAKQNGPERVDLVDPKADVTMQNGAWLMVRSRQGVFIQHANQVDMSGDVTLYRDDGTTMSTSSATVDLKAGAATSAQMTHVEGPFGTLDAQGFTMTDSGGVTQFPGPGHLILNGRK